MISLLAFWMRKDCHQIRFDIIKNKLENTGEQLFLIRKRESAQMRGPEK